jgi:putative transposase
MKLVPSQILETTMEDFQQSLDSLWRKGKKLSLRRKKESNTCRISRKNEFNFKYNSPKYLTIVRLGNIKMAEPLRYEFNDNIKVVTIKKMSNRYFISISMEVPNEEPIRKTGKTIAFDWGNRVFLTGFDGSKFHEYNFDPYKQGLLNKNIKRKQKALSSKKLNSKNFFKAKAKHEKVQFDRTNFQEDYIKKLVLKLVNEYDDVILENLNLGFIYKGFNKTNKKSSNDKPFYKFKVYLYNKFKQNDRLIYEVDKTNTSKKCYHCGYIHTKLGSSKEFNCPNCDIIIDRDKNAALNIFHQPNREIINLK